MNVLDEPIASGLNRFLDSPLRIEVEDFTRPPAGGLMNLTAVAHHIQATLDDLDSASADELASPRTTEEGGFRIVWHARQRRPGEEDEPVIV